MYTFFYIWPPIIFIFYIVAPEGIFFGYLLMREEMSTYIHPEYKNKMLTRTLNYEVSWIGSWGQHSQPMRVSIPVHTFEYLMHMKAIVLPKRINIFSFLLKSLDSQVSLTAWMTKVSAAEYLINLVVDPVYFPSYIIVKFWVTSPVKETIIC